jgi:hypothetical protein
MVQANMRSLAERGDDRFWTQVAADLLVRHIDAR